MVLSAPSSAHRLQRAVFSAPSLASHLQRAVFSAPSSARRLQRTVLSEPSPASHPQRAVFNAPSSARRLQRTVFSAPSSASHLQRAILSAPSSARRLQRAAACPAPSAQHRPQRAADQLGSRFRVHARTLARKKTGPHARSEQKRAGRQMPTGHNSPSSPAEPPRKVRCIPWPPRARMQSGNLSVSGILYDRRAQSSSPDLVKFVSRSSPRTVFP